MRKHILFASLWLLPLGAQEAGRAVLGYVVDGVKIELRPVEGASASARIGAAIALPEGVRRIDVASGHEWALLDRGVELPPLDLDLNTGAIREWPVAEGGFARVVSSPNGRRVLLVRDGRYEIWERGGASAGFTKIADGGFELSEAGSVAVSNTEPEIAVATLANGRVAVGFDAASRLFVATARGELLDGDGKVLAEDPELSKCVGIWAGDPGYVIAASAKRIWRVDLADGSVTVEELTEARMVERWRMTGLLHLGGKLGMGGQLYSTLATAESRRRWVPALTIEGGAQ